MSSMSYCIFQNLRGDLRDALGSLQERGLHDRSREELMALKRCLALASELTEEVDALEVDDRLAADEENEEVES